MSKWVPTLTDSGKSLYAELADAIERDVASGVLQCGQQLPPYRLLADDLRFSPGTVARAYRALVERRVLMADRRRGTAVAHSSETEQSFLRWFDDHSARALNLSIGYPDPALDPPLSEIMKDIAFELDHSCYSQYPTGRDGPERLEIARKWLDLQSIPYSGLHSVTTQGAQHGLMLASAALFRRGDRIAASELTYPGMLSIAHRLGLVVIGLQEDEYGIIPDSLVEATRRYPIKGLYVIPTFSNPTGTRMNDKRKQELVAIARSRRLFVLEDEVHRGFDRHPSAAFVSLLPEQSVLVTSISKQICGGLRVGFIVATGTLSEQISSALQDDCIATPRLNLEILKRLIDTGLAKETLERRREQALQRSSHALDLLELESRTSRGSPFLWIDLDDENSSRRAVALLRESGIDVAAGSHFASAPGHRAGIRIALTAPSDDDRIHDALLILKNVINDRQLPGTTAFLV